MSKMLNIEINEYRNGRMACTWYGLQECAYFYHVHPSMIKALLYTGNPLPYLDETVTFDISDESGMDVIKIPGVKDPRNQFVVVPTGMTAEEFIARNGVPDADGNEETEETEEDC